MSKVTRTRADWPIRQYRQMQRVLWPPGGATVPGGKITFNIIILQLDIRVVDVTLVNVTPAASGIPSVPSISEEPRDVAIGT